MDPIQDFLNQNRENGDPHAPMPVEFILRFARPLTDQYFTYDEDDVAAGSNFAKAIMTFFFVSTDWDYSPIWTDEEGHLAIRQVFAMASYQKFTALLELFTSNNLIAACEVNINNFSNFNILESLEHH